MAGKWVPTQGYELIYVEGDYHVCQRGGDYYKEHIPIEEIAYRSIAVARDYDYAAKLLKALRENLERLEKEREQNERPST